MDLAVAFVCVSIAALDVFVFTDVFDELSECSEMSACASEMETLTVEIRGEPLQTYLSGPKNNCLQQHKIEALLWTPPLPPNPPVLQSYFLKLSLCVLAAAQPSLEWYWVQKGRDKNAFRGHLPHLQGTRKPSFGVVNSSDVPCIWLFGLDAMN